MTKGISCGRCLLQLYNKVKITPVYALDRSIFGVYTDRSNELTITPSMMEERRTIMTNNNRSVKLMITMGVQVVRRESSQR